MKKLMIAAAAAMAGASTFGGLCDPEAGGSDSCSVYNIKFTFKTLGPKTACKEGAKWLVTDSFPGVVGAIWYRNAAADSAAARAARPNPVERADYRGIANACATAGLIQNADLREVFWMDNATRKFEGIAWQCKASCFEGVRFRDCDLTNNGRLNYVLWEKKTELAISFPVFQVKAGVTDNPATEFKGTPKTLYFSRDAQNEMLIGRYGKKAQKVTAQWSFARLLHAQRIWAAGFGTYDVKNLRTKSISGNAVGLIMPVSGTIDHCGNRGRIFCALGFMCVTWQDWCCDGCYAGVELVPASGTWSLKYNAAATKKANADRATLASFVPAYMFYSNEAWADARNADPLLHTDNYYWWSDTTRMLFYKGGTAAAANLNNDDILDALADGACLVIDVVSDGVFVEEGEVDENGDPVLDEETGKQVITKSYIYPHEERDEDGNSVTVTDFELEDGVLPTSLFRLPVTPDEDEE